MHRERWMQVVGCFSILGAIAAVLMVPEVRVLLGLNATAQQPGSPQAALSQATSTQPPQPLAKEAAVTAVPRGDQTDTPQQSSLPSQQPAAEVSEAVQRSFRRVEVRMTDVDDLGQCFVNGDLVQEVEWSDPDGQHHEGSGDWLDITSRLQPGKRNQVRFTLWNADGPYGWKFHFQVREDGILIYDRKQEADDSSEGTKFEDTLAYPPQ